MLLPSYTLLNSFSSYNARHLHDCLEAIIVLIYEYCVCVASWAMSYMNITQKQIIINFICLFIWEIKFMHKRKFTDFLQVDFWFETPAYQPSEHGLNWVVSTLNIWFIDHKIQRVGDMALFVYCVKEEIHGTILFQLWLRQRAKDQAQNGLSVVPCLCYRPDSTDSPTARLIPGSWRPFDDK